MYFWSQIMNQDIQIREMTLNDVDKVVQIYYKVYNSAYISFGELAAGLADGPGRPTGNAVDLFREEVIGLVTGSAEGQFVASIGNDVAGFALASLEDTDAGHLECWLNDLGVLPDYQGKKIGRRLVDRVIEWGTQGNAKYFLLESGLDNEQAHSFFETVGFHPIAVVFHRDA
jgi:GNAT superfamily N-acetyltransferase